MNEMMVSCDGIDERRGEGVRRLEWKSGRKAIVTSCKYAEVGPKVLQVALDQGRHSSLCFIRAAETWCKLIVVFKNVQVLVMGKMNQGGNRER